jgi:hypothetical protein
MTPFTPFLIVTSLYEVLVEGMKYEVIVHTSVNEKRYEKYHRTPSRQ